MGREEYRKTGRTNIIATWVCAVILAVLSYRNYGLAGAFFTTAATMFGTAALITGLYFIPFQEVIKGCVTVTIVGIATLVASILQGGSDRNFIASFFVLALATLYFDSRIILGYSVIYLLVCAGVCLVNPAYIDGTDYEMARVFIKLVIYAAVSAVLFAATRKGESLILASREAAEQISQSSKTAREVSENLLISVETGNGSMEEMAGNIGQISQSSSAMKADMQIMLERAAEMKEAMQRGDAVLSDNLECTAALAESYEDVVNGVRDGKTAVKEAESAVHSASDTVALANEAAGQLMDQMEKVGSILKEIQSIASKTNLLSLNASVEAARSGEHGKGFAVVAGEIRSLAVESAAAANDIQQIIDSLISVAGLVTQRVTGSASLLAEVKEQITDLDGCFRTLEKVSAEVNENVRKENNLIHIFQGDFEQIGDSIETVTQQVHDGVGMIEKIYASLHEQEAASEELASRLEEIASISASLRDKMCIA